MSRLGICALREQRQGVLQHVLQQQHDGRPGERATQLAEAAADRHQEVLDAGAHVERRPDEGHVAGPGDWIEAEQYLAEALATPDRWVKSNAEVIAKALSQARAELLRVEIVGAPPGATITTAARAPVKLDANGMVWLPPGDHSLRVEAPGPMGLIVIRALAQEPGFLPGIEKTIAEASCMPPAVTFAAPPRLSARDDRAAPSTQ